MSNVVKLGENVLLPGEANTELVETLEKLLNEAKSGELLNFAFVAVRKLDDGRYASSTGWDGYGTNGKFALHSGIATLLYRFTKEVME